MSEEMDNYGAEEILAGLGTQVFGHAGFHFFDDIGSTNDYAAELAERGCPEGTVVVADRQAKGKGQKGRKWFSPPGAGIYLSVVLRPKVRPKDAPKITLVAAVSAAETLISCAGLDIGIKWPNDIVVRGKKIAGILAETNIDGDAVNHVVLGVGINVNTRKGDLPDRLGGIATSVLMETGKPSPRSVLARVFLMDFETRYSSFLDGDFPEILARWKKLAVVRGKGVRIHEAGSVLEGTVVDVDHEGRLVIDDGGGRANAICSGEIEFL
jgi:BirA family biotin operon repressor/biotin-[acetyl-CoA-carboxylase] ligase